VKQTSFLDVADQANPPPGSYWIVVGEGHKVHPPGTKFLVIEEQGDWLLCWRDGKRPVIDGTGTILNRRFISGEKEQTTCQS